MLLVAVVGEAGDGKTSLLAQFSAHEITEGREIEGFLAIAGPRPDPFKGAYEYRLQWLSSGRTIPFAVRDESSSPPYRFDEAGVAETREWAENLSLQAPVPLVVLDEFSKFEARGEGHMAIWPAIVKANPKVVVMAVRLCCIEDVQIQLGRAFDVQIDARDPQAETKLREILASHREWIRIGTFGAASGGIEASLGAFLHGAQIPFSGFGLVAIQCGMLTYAAHDLIRKERTAWISLISAGLKALSPAGSRVRPMIAISIQGALYGASVRGIGWNRVGVAFAGGLAGAWAAVQGFLMQWLFVGSDLFKSYAWLQKQLANWGVSLPSLGMAICVLALLSAATSALVSLSVFARRERFKARIDRTLSTSKRVPSNTIGRWSPLVSTLRDLARPTFWIPVGLVVALAMGSGKPWESASMIAFRAVAVAFVLFALIHSIDMARMIGLLRRRGHWGPATAIEEGLGQEKSE